jgi:hypothetical protein
MSKVVIVTYTADAIFKVPKGINLEDKTQVKEWWVKYACLHIVFVDQTKQMMMIEAHEEIELDTKWGSDERIQDAYDWGISDDEYEEEDNPAKIAKKVVCDIFDKVKAEAEAKEEDENSDDEDEDE